MGLMAKSFFQSVREWFGSPQAAAEPADSASLPPPASPPPASAGPNFEGVRVLKHATAMRVIFFYPGEEGTYVDGPTVTLFENGIVHIRAKNEETTTHLQHCEILWRYEAVDETGKGGNKLRVVKFKKNNRSEDRGEDRSEEPAPPEGPAN